MAQNDIFHEKRHTRSFLKSFKWFKAILTSYYISHQTTPQNQIMDWDLDKGEILKTYKNEFEWLKTIFFMKKGIRDHFWKVYKWFQAILTSYYISHQTSPQTKSWIGT